MPQSSPTVRRRRLAAVLRRLRDTSGLTAEAAADRVGISKSALSRIENAQVSTMPAVARSLLQLYGVTGDELEALVQVAKDARKRGWWTSFDDVLPDWFATYVGLEMEAELVKTYHPQLVPGQLQTRAYARAIIGAAHPGTAEEEIARRVELRMQRQVADRRPKLWVVLDESILLRPVGGPVVMAEQLERLVDEAAGPSVDIQILPFAAGEHGAMGSYFSILTFAGPDESAVAYLENKAGSIYVEGAAVRDYLTLFDHLHAAALSQRDSTVMLTRRIQELRREGQAGDPR